MPRTIGITAEATGSTGATEERYRALIEYGSDLVSVLAPDGTILYVSPSVTPHLGHRPEELVGGCVYALVHPDDVTVLRRYLGRMARENEQAEFVTFRFRHRDASWRWLESVGSDQANNPAVGGIVVNSRDVTRWHEQRERIHRIMQDARCMLWDAIIVEMPADATHDVTWYSWEVRFAEEEAARRWLPISHETGQDFNDAWTKAKHPDDRERMDDTAAQALATDQPGYEQEYRCTLADGSERWLHEIVRIEPLPPLVDGAGTATGRRRFNAVGVCTDITERKRMQQLQERMREQMLRTEKLAALGELVAGIAHEVNNPLAVVSGHAQLLALSPDPRTREDAVAIRQAADRAARIVRSLLTFARQGGGEGERRTIPARRLIETCEDLVRAKLRRADVELATEAEGAVADAPVCVNETQIEQVLVNLINNAEHALRSTAHTPRITIRLRREDWGTAGEAGAWVAIYVEDNGPGMSPEVASRIWDPFFTTKGQGEGTGLGLSICHGILAAHGGGISLHRTASGEGTSFRLLLPVGGPVL